MNVFEVVTLFLVLLLLGLLSTSCTQEEKYTNWPAYLGDESKSQYSALKEIDTSNVHLLEMAWTYSSNDVDTNNRSQIQCNPLVINGILYGTSAKLKLFALDAETGREIWTFDPFDDKFASFGMGVNRGLAMHHSKNGLSRIFYSAGSRLYAIDSKRGVPIEEFGEGGFIELSSGLDDWSRDYFINSNSPGIIYNDLIIMGSRVSESTGAAPGHIRAFNVYSGKMEWIFKTIPHPGEAGYETWPSDAYLRIGGANVWAGFSIDQERGILYCPTGSAAYDFYGGDRIGDNLFANCILALDASTGERIWHYQIVHHDIWDKDLPTAPNLMDLQIGEETIPALVQVTKNGQLFVLNRVTGQPIFPIKEEKVPPSNLNGEIASSTQPIPLEMPSFSRQSISERDLANRSDSVAEYARHIYANTNHGNMFEPPSVKGTIFFPGFDGGGEWGGAAYDITHQNLIVNSNEVPWLCKMETVEISGKGQDIYKSICQSCHGIDFDGNDMFGNVPSLSGLQTRIDSDQFKDIVQKGQGVMPAFPMLEDGQVESIYQFINGLVESDNSEGSHFWPYPYRMRGYEKLYADDGYPIITPPWGQLTSVNIASASINWQVPLGNHSELNEIYDHDTGTENYGGPIVTSGGLIFIAATADEKIRAFNASSGEELWSHHLPAAGYATPSVYAVEGRQYIVIACGGGKLGTRSGDTYVAFALDAKGEVEY